MAHLKIKGRETRKLTEKWIGPYKIKKLKLKAVKLQLPKSMHIVSTVNISRVKPYKGALEGQSTDQPGPVEVSQEGHKEFEVEEVLDTRLERGKIKYLVH